MWESRVALRCGAFSSVFLQVCYCLSLSAGLIKETDTSYSKREPGELLHTSAMGYWKVRESICSSLKESAGCVGKAFLPCCLVLLRDGGAVGLSVQIAPREASPA